MNRSPKTRINSLRIDDRIVRISQPHVRPIKRGKAGSDTEFGAKVSISLVDGISFVDRISWDNFNEGIDLIVQIESYRKRFGCYPESVHADRIYRNRDNRRYCKKHEIRLSGPKLGRPPKATEANAQRLKGEKQQARQDEIDRNAVEGKFRQGKRRYSLNRIKRLQIMNGSKKGGPNMLLFRWVKIFIVCLILVGMMSCSDAKWEYVGTYPHLNKPNDIWFKGNTGLLAGYFSKLDNLLIKNMNKRWAKREAIILYINFNNEDGWLKTFSGNGEILQIISVSENSFYALGRDYLENGDMKSYILYSNNKNMDWEKRPSIPDLFDGIAMNTDNGGYAWTKDSVYATHDSASSWQKIADNILIDANNNAKPVMDNRDVLWVCSNNWIFGINSTGILYKEKLNFDLKVDYLSISQADNLFLIGRGGVGHKENVVLIKRTTENRYEAISTLPYFLPNNLCVGNNVISVFGSDMSKHPPRRMLMTSKNIGKTWESETPKDCYAHGPVFFENEKVLWNIATEDRIQRRILK